MSEIKQSVVSEARNLMGSALITQAVDTRGVGVAVYNTESNQKIAPTQFSEEFPPREPWVAEYMFWAQGYEIRVELIYKIAWNLPLLYTYDIELPIVASHTILASNDIDRDGMVDHLEQAYVEYAMHEESDTDWLHPVHRDGYGIIDTDPAADVDGDSVAGDTNPFDFNNDFTEDKFDSGPTSNQMRFNPIVGSRFWPHTP